MFQEMMVASGGGGGKTLVKYGASLCDNNGRVECGFEPKNIMIANMKYNGTSKNFMFWSYANSGANHTSFVQYYNDTVYTRTVGAPSQPIASIDSTGFTFTSGYGSYFQSSDNYMLVTDTE